MNRSRSSRTVAVCAVVAAAVGLALAAHAAPVYSTAVGKATFATYCANCHGEDLRGGGEIAGTLSKRPTDLTRITAKNDGVFPAERLALIIDGRVEVAEHGSREMPTWGELFLWPESDTPERRAQVERKIGELVAYIQAQQVTEETK